jgi:hypothetical protein
VPYDAPEKNSVLVQPTPPPCHFNQFPKLSFRPIFPRCHFDQFSPAVISTNFPPLSFRPSGRNLSGLLGGTRFLALLEMTNADKTPSSIQSSFQPLLSLRPPPISFFRLPTRHFFPRKLWLSFRWQKWLISG